MAREYDFRVLPLASLEPPTFAMRSEMDDEGLTSLAASIRRSGVLQPIGVFPVGDLFRIIWGHRRFVASGIAGEANVPCRVFSDGSAHEEDYKLEENAHQEPLNPADEATWLADLLERKFGGAITPLCEHLHVTESYINGRLDLLRGYDEVFDALRAKRINLAVARELNKAKEPDWMRHWLSDAIEQGATASVVTRWRIAREQQLKLAATTPSTGTPDANAITPAPLGSVDACAFCLDPSDPLEMEYVRVHKSCLKVRMREARAALAGQQ